MNDHNVSNMRVFPTSNSISLAISDRVIDLTNVSESSDSGAEAPNIVDAAAKTIGSEDGDHYNQFPSLKLQQQWVYLTNNSCSTRGEN